MTIFHHNGIIVHTSKGGLWETFTDRPFKIALALFAIYSGISGLLNFGSSNEVFYYSVWYPWAYNILFVASGLVVMTGVLMIKTNIEAAGLLLVVTSLTIRLSVILLSVGWKSEVHNMLAICIIFGAAALIRIYSIFDMNQRKDREE